MTANYESFKESLQAEELATRTAAPSGRSATDLLEKVLNRGMMLVLLVAGGVGVWWYLENSRVDPAKTAHLMLDGQSFGDRVLASPRPVLVDFSATWCGPCQQQKGYLHEIEQKYAGRLDVVIVDVDRNPELAGAYGVSGIPALRVFSGGQLVGQSVGCHDVPGLESLLTEAKVMEQLTSPRAETRVAAAPRP